MTALAAVVAPVDARAQSAAPEIASATEIAVDEGVVSVATLFATDSDTPSDDLEWSTVGGDDAAAFTLSPSGVLAFASAPDYEQPGTRTATALGESRCG